MPDSIPEALMEEVADLIDRRWPDLDDGQRRELANLFWEHAYRLERRAKPDIYGPRGEPLVPRGKGEPAGQD